MIRATVHEQGRANGLRTIPEAACEQEDPRDASRSYLSRGAPKGFGRTGRGPWDRAARGFVVLRSMRDPSGAKCHSTHARQRHPAFPAH